MRSDTSSLDLYFLTRELQALVGGKVDKIYEKDDDRKDLLFAFHVTGKGKLMLRFKLPGFVFLTERKEEYPETPPGYCMFLRKYLGQARLLSLEQVGFQRMLRLTFEKRKEGKSETFILIVELFSKGNMILCDSDLRIKNPLENQHWTGREVRGKQLYVFPPEQTNTPGLDEQCFADILLGSNKESLVKSLAIDFALGGIYAEEIIARAKIDKSKKPKDTTKQEAAALHVTLTGMLKEPLKPIKVGEDILPFPFVTVSGETTATPGSQQAIHDDQQAAAGDMQAFPSFSAAIDSVQTKAAGHKEEQARKEKKAKIDTIIAAQEEKIKEFENAAKENQRKGELIYEHYQELKDILADINELRKEKGWAAVKEKYKGHPLVKKVDKDGTITLSLP